MTTTDDDPSDRTVAHPDDIIREMAMAGEARLAIAHALGQSIAFVNRRARALGLRWSDTQKAGRDAASWSPPEDDALRELVGRPMSVTDLASRLRRPRPQVRLRIEQLGLRPPPSVCVDALRRRNP